MNACLIGDGLISLTLAKTLVNNKIKVFMYCNNSRKIHSSNRTVGITSNNLDFFQKEIKKLKKNIYWKIDQIEIYNEIYEKGKILNFHDQKKTLFSIIKYNDLYDLINKDLKKNKNFKKINIKDNSFYKKIIKRNNYNLIINCDGSNEISKRYFYRKILKNYESTAYVTIINHKKNNNKKAIQIFTKLGPIAFLPISKTQTSIVYSIKNKDAKKNLNLSQEEFEKLIFANNKKYKINSIKKFETFKLNSKSLRNYYNKNILAFGDLLHQIHPLSGQGFNMTLRDIRIFLMLIKDRKNLGLPIDYSIYKQFENKTKHLNFIFSTGNDFIYEFFNYENFFQKLFSKKIFNYLNSNDLFNKIAIKYADKGLII